MLPENVGELSLIQALAADARPDDIRSLADGLDYGLVGDLLEHLDLLALLGLRLLSHSPSGAPQSFRERVDREREARQHAAAREGALIERLTRALAARGVPALTLGGAYASERLHGDPALRSSGEVHLLVADEHAEVAIAVIEKDGYAPDSTQDFRHHDGLRLSTADAPAITVYVRMSWWEKRFARHMLAHSGPEDSVREPTPSDELISLLMFYARDGLVGLAYPVDVVAWWRRFAQGPHLARAGRVVMEHPGIERAVIASAVAMEQTLGLPLQSAMSLGSRAGARAAARWCDWAALRPPSDREIVVKIIDGLLSPPARLPWWLKRSLAPVDGGDDAGLRGHLSRAAHVCGRAVPLYARLAMGRPIGVLPQAACPDGGQR